MQGVPGLERTTPPSCGHAGGGHDDAVRRTEMGRARFHSRQPRRQFYPQWRETLRRAVWEQRVAGRRAFTAATATSTSRHGRACPGHLRLTFCYKDVDVL